MPNFENASLAEVETAVRCTPQRHHALRLRAIRALGTGLDLAAVAHFCDVSPATVQRWIRTFNQGGIDALLDKPRSGRPRVLSAGQFRTEVVPLLEAPSAAGEHHWTAVKLHGHLAAELQITLGYSTLLRHLHEHGWVLRIPRPWPLPPSDDLWHQQRTAFLPGFKSLLLSDPLARVFFADEAGFEGDPRPRSTWARKGSHPHNLQTGKHIRLSAIGAVEPATGACSALLCDGCESDVFQAFLDTLAAEHPPEPGRTFHLVLDNASWHTARRLHWHHFTPVYLPPYSPDYNAIERLWLHLKSKWFAGFTARTEDAHMSRRLEAFASLFASPALITSQCRISGDDF